MSLVENERTKLLASALNTTAVATIVTGVIGPAVGFFYGFSNLAAGSAWFFLGLVWFLLGIGIHLIAQWILGRLKDAA